jgi:hypothetical protein
MKFKATKLAAKFSSKFQVRCKDCDGVNNQIYCKCSNRSAHLLVTELLLGKGERENVSDFWVCPTPKKGLGGKGKCDTEGLPYAGLSTDQVRAV